MLELKVQRYVIIPICSVYDKGNLVREDRLKPIIHCIGNEIDLVTKAKQLEEEAKNEPYFRAKTTNGR